MHVQFITCSCGNRALMLILPCEVYCPECHCVIEQLHWKHDGEPKPALDG